MIEISFWKIMLVLVVALVVLGPEQLPKAARTFGSFISTIRKSLGKLQTEISALEHKDSKAESEKE